MCAVLTCFRLAHPRALSRPPPAAPQVQFAETKTSFAHFLTSVCAIVGGVFTVSGLVDSFLYHGHRVLKKKMELGKHI
jgi:hypothetical protein